MYVYLVLHADKFTFMKIIFIYSYIVVYIGIRTYKLASVNIIDTYTYVFVFTHTHTYAHAHTHTHTHTHTNKHTYTYTHTHT